MSDNPRNKKTEKKNIPLKDRDIQEQILIKDFAIASAIQGIGIGDLDGNIIYVNEAAVKMWGADDPKELMGRSVLELAESKKKANEALAAVLEKGRWEGEIAGIKKDGSLFIVLMTANLVYNEKGKPIYTMASMIDITDRKKMEEELRIKDLAIASAIQGIGIADLEGNIIYVNDAAVKMWGADDPKELIGQSAVQYAQSQEQANEIMGALLEKGRWEGEVAGRSKDGSLIYALHSANLVYNDQGKPVYIMTSFIDITQRKKMEEELRIKDFAIASAINAIIIGDLEGNISYVNRSFLDLWGDNDLSSVIGKPAISFARDRQLARRVLEELLTKGSWYGEIEGVRKDGAIITVLASANIVFDADKNPLCLMASLVDITDRKNAEKQLIKINEELETRVAERTEELRQHSINLQETNTALKILLEQRERDKEDLENKVLANVKSLILPNIEKLKHTPLDNRQKTFVDIIETNIHEIVSPYLRKLSTHYRNFTPMQIQVADLVKAGKTTKEISELLGLSDRAIEFHRNNIRDKLGLKNKKMNLRSYLLSLS